MPDPGGVKNTADSPLKIIMAVTVACVLAGILAFVFLPDRTPMLNREILQSNRSLWAENGSEDYDLAITVEVDRQDKSRAEVSFRNGKITSQSYNGLAREGKDDSYTVEGLFRTMERELNLALDGGITASTILKAEFDSRLGFPVIFKKLTTRKGARSYVIRLEQLRSQGGGILFPIGQP